MTYKTNEKNPFPYRDRSMEFKRENIAGSYTVY